MSVSRAPRFDLVLARDGRRLSTSAVFTFAQRRVTTRSAVGAATRYVVAVAVVGALTCVPGVGAEAVTRPAGGFGASTAESGQARADFNGDGYADLAVGAPGDSIPGVAGSLHGTVSVLYGSASGVTAVDQLWHRNRAGVKGVASGMVSSEGDECCPGAFGAVLASGDFNGDGFDDLVARANANPQRFGVRAQHVSVNVIYGSRRGLTAYGDQLWSLASAGVKGNPGLFDFDNLVVGDFNRDRRDDLVFTSRDTASAACCTTRVHMLAGSRLGLTASGDAFLSRASRGVAGAGEFGETLAVGDFDGSGADDLAVAAFASRREGSVSVFYGGAGGISPSRDEVWSAATPGVPGVRSAFANFGNALAAGDFDGDGRDELAVRNGIEGAAYVLVLRGTSGGLTAGGPTPVFRHSSSGLPETKAVVHDFGRRLAAADVTGDGRDELAIKDGRGLLPDQTRCVDDEAGMGAGMVFLLRGSPDGLTTTGSQVIGATNLRFVDRPVPVDVCLRSIANDIAFDDHNGDGYLDLSMSYGAEHVGFGIAWVPGDQGGANPGTAALWRAETPGISAQCCFSSLPQRQHAEW